MDFGEIASRLFRLSWRYEFLRVFGALSHPAGFVLLFAILLVAPSLDAHAFSNQVVGMMLFFVVLQLFACWQSAWAPAYARLVGPAPAETGLHANA